MSVRHAQLYLMVFSMRREKGIKSVDFIPPMYNLMILSTSPFIIYHLSVAILQAMDASLNLKCVMTIPIRIISCGIYLKINEMWMLYSFS